MRDSEDGEIDAQGSQEVPASPHLGLSRVVSDGRLFLLGAVPAALLFLATAPRTITLDDAGLFAMLCNAGAVMHPPGYPAYALLCGGAAQLPLPSVFLALVVLSALLGALTCGVVALIARTLGAGAVGGIVAAWLLAAATGFLAQATIPEVYSYNTLVTTVLLLLVLRIDAAPSPGRIGLVGLVTGLGLAGHWPLFLASGPALLLAVLARGPLLRRVLTDARRLLAGLAGLLLGLLPYLWMVWRLLDPPATSFTDVANAEDVFGYLRRDFYAEVDAVAGVTRADRLAWFAWLPRLALDQFGAWLLLVPVGLWALRGRPWLVAAVLALLACHTLVLLSLLSWPFEFRRQSLFEAFPLMAWCGIAITVGVAVGALLEWLRAGIAAGAGAVRVVAPAAILSVVALQLVLAGGAHVRARGDHVDAAGRDLLEGLPPGALLVVDSDPMTTVLGYLHFVEGVRPDLRLRHYLVLIFPERLYDWGPTSARRRAVAVQLDREDVYFTGRLDHDGAVSNFGAVQRASRAAATGLCEVPEAHARAALTLAAAPIGDAPGRQFRDLVVSRVTLCLLDRVATDADALAQLNALQVVPVAARISMSRLFEFAPSPARDLELYRLAAQLRANPEIDPSREVAGVTLLLTGLAALLDVPGVPADPVLARSEFEAARRLLGAEDARVVRAFERLAAREVESGAGAAAPPAGADRT